MPLTAKGRKIKRAMEAEYGKKKGEAVFYASENKGSVSGVKQHNSPPRRAKMKQKPTRKQRVKKAAKGLKRAFPSDKQTGRATGLKLPKAKRQEARKAYQRAKKKPVGEGSRFKAVEKSAKASGARNPAAVAAAVGRKKYGKKRMQRMAAAGRRK